MRAAKRDEQPDRQHQQAERSRDLGGAGVPHDRAHGHDDRRDERQQRGVKTTSLARRLDRASGSAGVPPGTEATMPRERENYDLPKRPPLPFRQAAVMVGVVLLALSLWFLLPSSPITVALIAVILLATVFTGVGLVLRSKELDEKPGRNPVTPPSIDT